MNNKLILTLSSIALCASLSTAYAGGGSSGQWYVGADVGSTDNNTSVSNVFTNGACANAVVNCTVDDGDKAARFVAGYNVSPNLAIELGYADLGNTADVRPSNSATGASAIVQQETSALSLSAIGKKKLGASKFSAVGKLGIAYWDSDITFTRTPALAVFPNQTQSKSDYSPVIGLGVEYAVNQQWNIRAGWDRYFGVGEREQAIDMINRNIQTVDTDVDMFSVGATVSF